MNEHTISRRQKHFDALRGVAASIVVLTHYMAAFYPYSIFGLQESYQKISPIEEIFYWPPFGLAVAGNFAVCLFFILSGYVLSYKHLGRRLTFERLAVLSAKRPLRLGGLVIFSMILGAALWKIGLFSNDSVSEVTHSIPWFSNFWKGDFDLHRLIVNLTTAPFSNGNLYNPPLWTIQIELYGSLMVFLYLFLFGDSSFRPLVAIFLLVLMAHTFYACFWIGVLLADWAKSRMTRDLSLSIFSRVFLVFLVAFLGSYPNYITQGFAKQTELLFFPA